MEITTQADAAVMVRSTIHRDSLSVYASVCVDFIGEYCINTGNAYFGFHAHIHGDLPIDTIRRRLRKINSLSRAVEILEHLEVIEESDFSAFTQFEEMKRELHKYEDV